MHPEASQRRVVEGRRYRACGEGRCVVVGGGGVFGGVDDVDVDVDVVQTGRVGSEGEEKAETTVAEGMQSGRPRWFCWKGEPAQDVEKEQDGRTRKSNKDQIKLRRKSPATAQGGQQTHGRGWEPNKKDRHR